MQYRDYAKIYTKKLCAHACTYTCINTYVQKEKFRDIEVDKNLQHRLNEVQNEEREV